MGSWKLDLCFHSGEGLDSDRCFAISLSEVCLEEMKVAAWKISLKHFQTINWRSKSRGHVGRLCVALRGYRSILKCDFIASWCFLSYQIEDHNPN